MAWMIWSQGQESESDEQADSVFHADKNGIHDLRFSGQQVQHQSQKEKKDEKRVDQDVEGKIVQATARSEHQIHLLENPVQKH
jgi:hypothetical protein